MDEIVLEIKKYRGYVNTAHFPFVPNSVDAVCSQLRSRLIALMAEETNCVMTGVEFPEEKKREMSAIASFLYQDVANDEE